MLEIRHKLVSFGTLLDEDDRRIVLGAALFLVLFSVVFLLLCVIVGVSLGAGVRAFHVLAGV